MIHLSFVFFCASDSQVLYTLALTLVLLVRFLIFLGCWPKALEFTVHFCSFTKFYHVMYVKACVIFLGHFFSKVFLLFSRASQTLTGSVQWILFLNAVLLGTDWCLVLYNNVEILHVVITHVCKGCKAAFKQGILSTDIRLEPLNNKVLYRAET